MTYKLKQALEAHRTAAAALEDLMKALKQTSKKR